MPSYIISPDLGVLHSSQSAEGQGQGGERGQAERQRGKDNAGKTNKYNKRTYQVKDEVKSPKKQRRN